MKKCPKCNNRYSDNREKCPDYSVPLDLETKTETQTPYNTSDIIDSIYSENNELKRKVILIVAIIISFLIGIGVSTIFNHSVISDMESKLEKTEENNANLQKQLDSWESKFSVTTDNPNKASDIAKKDSSLSEEQSQQAQYETTATNSGEMPKNYKPVGNEPNWLEITAYCQTLMPDVIGYEADISTDENYTKIIRTNLRYKVETSRLKIKPEGSYHKAIFIIEFENENYERYKMTTAEVDGVKFK